MPRLLVALALASLVCTGRAAGTAPLRIAYSSISGAMLPLWVAKDKKLFEKHGVDVEVTYIRGVANHLQKSISVDLEGVKGLLKGLGSEAAGANPSSFVDASLVQELEKDLSFQQRNR